MDKEKATLQEDFLGQLHRGRHLVTVFTTNGFQMRGRITAYDQFTLLVEDANGQQNLVYKSAVSTIVRAEPARP